MTENKNNVKSAWALIAVLAVVALILVCGLSRRSSSGVSLAPKIAAPTTHEITYELSGSTYKASITIENEHENTEQHDVKLPYSKSFTSKSPSQFLYISAQKEDKAGTLTCKILVDGISVSEATTTAEYGIASCDYLLP